MKSLKKKIKKILSKPTKGNPVMVEMAHIKRLEKLMLELAEEIDKLREEKEDKRKTSYASYPSFGGLETVKEETPRDYIKKRITEIICDKLGVGEEEMKEEANFRDDLGADSMDEVELLMEFEKEFNVGIPDSNAETVKTVKDAVDLMHRLINEKGK